MKILVINGPNLNMLGLRDPDIYGQGSYSDLCSFIEKRAAAIGAEVDIYQSNHEGELIDMILSACTDVPDGVIINAGAYTHYSYAIRDALELLKCPVVEVHLSDIYNREDFRKVSVIKDVCCCQICGYGFESYAKALDAIKDRV